MVDHFTQYAKAYATRNMSGNTAASLLYNVFILCFRFPSKVHHDQDGEFENELFHRLEEQSDVIHSQTTPYHPHCNEKTFKRFNRTPLSMLCTLTEDTSLIGEIICQNKSMLTIVPDKSPLVSPLLHFSSEDLLVS